MTTSTPPATTEQTTQNVEGITKPTSTEKSAAPDTIVSPGRAQAPPIGSKIQVLWRIVHGEDAAVTTSDTTNNANASAGGAGESESLGRGETTTATENVEERWWGAVVQECLSETVGDRSPNPAHANLNIYILLYDAYGDFSEELVRVAFLPDNTLLDLSMLDDAGGGKLDWRFESDAMNDDDDTNDETTLVRSAECLAREADQLVQLCGISADADLHALSRMPHDVQLHVASGYRSFADSVKSMLSELMASKPTDYVVTAEDVQDIMARVRARQRQQSVAGAAVL